GKLSDDFVLTAVDDDIGDDFREVGSARNREQMILASCAGNLREVACPEPAGTGQHSSGHGDVAVPCKVLNDFEWRVVVRCQPLAEFGFRAAFDPGDENT